jgi:REP element-mobilizing transposase RayT
MSDHHNENRIYYQGEFEIYRGERLPHWEVADGIYFATFRLADAIPTETAERLAERYRAMMEALDEEGDVDERTIERIGFEFHLEHVDPHLDEGRGACWMMDERIARLVQEALHYFDGERYRLIAWCIMGNHVHVDFAKSEEYRLKQIYHSWKSYTGSEANDMLGRSGPFWKADTYDHLIRTESELVRTGKYILKNPDAAGLEDWPWKGVGDYGGPIAA